MAEFMIQSDYLKKSLDLRLKSCYAGDQIEN